MVLCLDLYLEFVKSVLPNWQKALDILVGLGPATSKKKFQFFLVNAKT